MTFYDTDGGIREDLEMQAHAFLAERIKPYVQFGGALLNKEYIQRLQSEMEIHKILNDGKYDPVLSYVFDQLPDKLPENDWGLLVYVEEFYTARGSIELNSSVWSEMPTFGDVTTVQNGPYEFVIPFEYDHNIHMTEETKLRIITTLKEFNLHNGVE